MRFQLTRYWQGRADSWAEEPGVGAVNDQVYITTLTEERKKGHAEQGGGIGRRFKNQYFLTSKLINFI